MRFRSAVVPVLVVCGMCMPRSGRAAELSWWSASLGAPPDSACWELIDTAPLADPVVTGGRLVLSTTVPVDAMYYQQSGARLSVPATWVMEAGLRVVAESHAPGPRWGAAIGFAAAPGSGNVLLLGAGQIMLWSSFGAAGPTATIPMSDRVHDYRVEVRSSGTISVFQDGQLVLTGALISDPAFGTTPYVYFGDGSSTGSSTTEWIYFRHDGAASACAAVVGADAPARRPEIAFATPTPNPASRDVLLRFELPRGAAIGLTIFDAAGRRVRTLESGRRASGAHAARWDLDDDTGRPVKPGLYFARFEAEDRRLVHRLVVTR